MVSSCYDIAAGAPVICQLIGVAMRPLSPRRPITGRLGTRQAWQQALPIYRVGQKGNLLYCHRYLKGSIIKVL